MRWSNKLVSLIKTPFQRGASAQAYALVVGLISVVALGTVQGSGSSVKALFTDVSDELGRSSGELAAASIAPSPSPLAPTNLAINIVAGDPDNMTVTGPGSPAAGSTTNFFVVNTGDITSQALSVSFDTGSNFALTLDACSGQVLPHNTACQIGVQASASSAGSFTDAVTITDGNATATVNLSATATSFDPAAITFVSGSGSFSLNGSSPSACNVFTFQNSGNFATSSMTASIISGGSSFELTGCTNNCSGQTLSSGQTCTVGARYKAIGNGSQTGTLRVLASTGGSAQVALSGTATNMGCPQGSYETESGSCVGAQTLCNHRTQCVNTTERNIASGGYVGNFLWDSGSECGNDYTVCPGGGGTYSPGATSNASCSWCASGTMTCVNNTAASSCSGMIQTGYCYCN